MIITKNLNNYINDTEYKITITNAYINIKNYIEIKDYSSTKIIIKNPNGVTIITGINLIINKMIDNELLITGNFSSVEL